MSKIYKGAIELVGSTPLVEVTNIEKKEQLKARLLVKLEYFNPAGSVKDRVGKAMIEDAERTGRAETVPLSLSLPQATQALVWPLSRQSRVTE